MAPPRLEPERSDSSLAIMRQAASSSSDPLQSRKHSRRQDQRPANIENLNVPSTQSTAPSAPHKPSNGQKLAHRKGNHNSHHHRHHHHLNDTHSHRPPEPDTENASSTQSRVNEHSRTESKAEPHSRASSSNRKERSSRRHDPRAAHPAFPDASAPRDGRQLFDPRRHDPVKFASQQRCQAAADDQSRASGTSIVTPSSSINTFPTRSTSSSSVPNPHQLPKDPSTSFDLQRHIAEIKGVYRNICTLEAKLQQLHRSEAGKERDISQLDVHPPSVQQLDHSYWLRLTASHRELAELHSAFLELSMSPDLPESIQELPHLHKLPSRMWQTAFHLMLERLRHNLPTLDDGRLAQSGADLLDHFTEFIYFAYAFYTTLYETERFKPFRKAWIESLGDLARYRMAVAGLSASLTPQNQTQAPAQSSRDPTLMRIDDDDSPDGPADRMSAGSAALADWDFVEKETWRQTARDWYARGLAESPHSGRLHHHLGILSRYKDFFALYHFCRSLTTARSFPAAKETVLSLFDQQRQSRRLQPDASLEDLFIYLHGTLLTRVQLDDFDVVFSRLEDKLRNQHAARGPRHYFTESQWMMAAMINIAAILQFGSEQSIVLGNILRRTSAQKDNRASRTAKSKVATPKAILVNQSAKQEDLSAMGSDDAVSDDASDLGDDPYVIAFDVKDDGADVEKDIPLTLTLALKLTFSMLGFCLRKALQEGSTEDTLHTINPYGPILLTFVLSIAHYRRVYRLVERYFPWEDLLLFLEQAPKDIVIKAFSSDSASKISDEIPLPEDWCLKGTSGVGRHVYERNFWKHSHQDSSISSTHTFQTEVEVIDSEDLELHEKFLDYHKMTTGHDGLDSLRLNRMVFVATRLSKITKSLEHDSRSGKMRIGRSLAAKLTKWRLEAEQREIESHFRSLQVSKSSQEHDSGSFKEDADASDYDSYDDDQNLDDAPEAIRQLRERRRYLKSVLRSAMATAPESSRSTTGSRNPKNTSDSVSKVPRFAAGYTVLVIDTNVLVTPGELLRQLVESKKWMVIVPLAVITELDGLKRNNNTLGEEADRAIKFLESHIRSHTKYLKVQTSRGNYLTDLTIRSEDIDFGFNPGHQGASHDKSAAARNVDEVILRALAWQMERFVDRLDTLSANPAEDRAKLRPGTAKSALLTLDRNLRLKANARGLCGLDESEIADLMVSTLDQGRGRPQRDEGS